MTYRVKGRARLLAALLLYLSAQTISATQEIMPDIELLEFLGTIAGLESMGVEIDELLAGSETDIDDEDSATESDTEADTEAVAAVDKGERNE